VLLKARVLPPLTERLPVPLKRPEIVTSPLVVSIEEEDPEIDTLLLRERASDETSFASDSERLPVPKTPLARLSVLLEIERAPE
jgi:hypothetical protein